jgi:intracellular septation protein A
MIKSMGGTAETRKVRRAAWTLAKGAFPAVAVATLIPLVLFYTAMMLGSIVWAIGVSVAYAYGVAAYQYARRRRVSGMLLMTVFMVTVRAIASAASGQMVLYFAVPVLETAGFGLMFIATMFSSEPLIVRLVRDLVPHAADDLASRKPLIKTLSIIWTATYLGSGATTLALLTTVPLPVYMGAHTLTGWFWTGSGVTLSIALCRRQAAGLFNLMLRRAPALPAAVAVPAVGVTALPVAAA